jgi:hypothetical protein
LAGNLVDRCSSCGCSSNTQNCLEDGSCAYECQSDSDCNKLGAGYECKDNKCWKEQRECNSDLDCPSGKYCDNGECKKLKQVVSDTPITPSSGGAGAPAPTLFGKPCISEWTCTEIGECELHYSITNLVGLKPEEILQGKSERECTDINGCAPPRIESIACQKTLPVTIEREVYCDENYVNIYNLNGTLIATLKEREAAVDISIGLEGVGVTKDPCLKEKPAAPISPNLLAPVPTTLAQISKSTLALALMALIVLIIGEIIILSTKPIEAIAVAPYIPKIPEFPGIESSLPGRKIKMSRISVRKIPEPESKSLAKEIAKSQKIEEKLKVHKIPEIERKAPEKLENIPEPIKKIIGIEKELHEIRQKIAEIRQAKLESMKEHEEHITKLDEIKKQISQRLEKTTHEKTFRRPAEVKNLEQELSAVRKQIQATRLAETEHIEKPYQERIVKLDSMKEKLRKETEEVGQKMSKEKSSKESLELEKKLRKIREEIKDVDRIIKS